MLGRVLGKILADLIGLKEQGQPGEGIEAAKQTLISGSDSVDRHYKIVMIKTFL
jgi:hypothetical protein